jgi:hypothetical protein
MRKLTPRVEAITRYVADLKAASRGEGTKPTPPPGLTEKEFVRAMARQLGITEQWFRRRYWKEIRKQAARSSPLTFPRQGATARWH